MSLGWTTGYNYSRVVREIFFRGDKVIFPDIFFPGVKCFCPVENSHFGRPKTNFSGFQKRSKTKKKKKKKRAKKKKKKKKVLSSFCNFSPFQFNFSTFPFFYFPSFLLYFPFFLASLFPVGQQKFPGEKCQGRGAICPLPLTYRPSVRRHCGGEVLRIFVS